MSDDCLKLTTYFGERARAGGRFLADALIDVYARNELQVSLVMRGALGFGIKHSVRTDRLLTLSEDLPMVAVAVDTRPRIEAALREVDELHLGGLVTLERARMLTCQAGGLELPDELLREAVKLTVYVGRHQRLGGRPAHQAIVELLRERGVDGATVLLGVDGTVHGRRLRAGFFAANAEVPLMVVALGAAESVAAAGAELAAWLPRPLMTLERVRVCKRDGRRLAQPRQLSETDGGGRPMWQQLTVYAGEASRHRGRPLAPQLVRALREAGAAGATSLRGVWGYHGDHQPHGDRFWALRRHVPAVTVIIDTPGRSRRWFEIVDRLTDETGLVTSEMVPAYRAAAPGLLTGGLELAGEMP
ncbi:MAG: hypothetical protein QOF77_2384 [Solirubrobacteraceae bacterium]|nr:hypothetical protein [Solirubrobacteraceae bacterium]